MPLRRRSIANLALAALLLAGAGTYAATRYTHTPTPPVPAALKAVPGQAGAVVRELRQAPAALHAPALPIQRAAGQAAAPAPAAGRQRALRPEWERHPLGRGEIIEHH